MRLVIDIDIDAFPGDPEKPDDRHTTGKEMARILRYWAGALPGMDLVIGTEQVLMDSSYNPVGHLRVTE